MQNGWYASVATKQKDYVVITVVVSNGTEKISDSRQILNINHKAQYNQFMVKSTECKRARRVQYESSRIKSVSFTVVAVLPIIVVKFPGKS